MAEGRATQAFISMCNKSFWFFQRKRYYNFSYFTLLLHIKQQCGVRTKVLRHKYLIINSWSWVSSFYNSFALEEIIWWSLQSNEVFVSCFLFIWRFCLWIPGEELSKKQAAQESTIRKLRAQVSSRLTDYLKLLMFQYLIPMLCLSDLRYVLLVSPLLFFWNFRLENSKKKKKVWWPKFR